MIIPPHLRALGFDPESYAVSNCLHVYTRHVSGVTTKAWVMSKTQSRPEVKLTHKIGNIEVRSEFMPLQSDKFVNDVFPKFIELVNKINNV